MANGSTTACAPEPICFGPPLDPSKPQPRPVLTSLYERVTRRIRAAQTLFGDNVKLVLRQLEDEQWALLTPPYCLVVPTVTRPQLRPIEQDADSILNPRSITLITQLDARGSEAEWAAASDIELAEKQLIGCLVNWRPQAHYLPTQYAGMRVQNSRVPDVKVSFVFQFNEQLVIEDDAALIAEAEDGPLVINRIQVTVCDPTCEGVPYDPRKPD